MDDRIDPADLVKSQCTDAQKWAKALCQGTPLDENIMLSWFANAMMNVHDSLHNTKIKSLRKEVLAARAMRDNSCVWEGHMLLVDATDYDKIRKDNEGDGI